MEGALADNELSPEELLALESLDLMETHELEDAVLLQQEEVLEEEEVLLEEDDIWKLPEPAEGPQIRFAEDILGGSYGQRAGGRSKKKRSSRNSGSAPQRGGNGRASQHAGPAGDSDSEDE